MATQQQTILTLSAVAAAALVAGLLAWMWFGSSTEIPTTPEDAIDTTSPEVSPLVSDETSAPVTDGAFNLNVLQRSGYKALDLRPIQNGQLPIKPPATTGKANPFL